MLEGLLRDFRRAMTFVLRVVKSTTTWRRCVSQRCGARAASFAARAWHVLRDGRATAPPGASRRGALGFPNARTTRERPDGSLPGKERAQGFYLRPLETAASEALLVLRRRAARDSATCYTPHCSNQPCQQCCTLLAQQMHTVRLIYPHDSPKNQLDGHLCTLARLRSSSLLAVTKEKAQEPWERQHKESAVQCIHRQRKHHCGNSCLDAAE